MLVIATGVQGGVMVSRDGAVLALVAVDSARGVGRSRQSIRLAMVGPRHIDFMRLSAEEMKIATEYGCDRPGNADAIRRLVRRARSDAKEKAKEAAQVGQEV